MNGIIYSIKDEIIKADTIAVTAHISEDYDALGSVFAMKEALRIMGKSSVVYLSEELSGNKLFFDDEYEINVPENPGYDLLICLDCGDMGRLEGREKLFKSAKRTVNIDHHYTNTNFADVNWVEGEKSSTGEMLASFIPVLSGMNKKIASYIYASLLGDTGCFKYRCVTYETMYIAADLLRYDIDHSEIAKKLIDTEKIESIMIRGEIMQNVKSYFDGKVNMVTADEALFKVYGIDEKEVGSIVDIPRRIKGTEIAASMKVTKEKINISIRSGGKANVANVAQAFGGGGHKMAAGGVSTESLEKTIEIFLKECEKELERAGI